MRVLNNLVYLVIYICCVCSLLFTVKPLIVKAQDIVINLNEDMEEENLLYDDFIKISSFNSETDSNYEDTDSLYEDTEGAEEVVNNEWEVMIIFCFGLIAGIIAGHFLTGFIK